jgi:hypothetical protein
MTVSVLTCQGAILADEITVTYLESRSEEEIREEIHGTVVGLLWIECEEIVFLDSQ